MQVLIKLEETIHTEVFPIHCKIRTGDVIKIWQKRGIFLFQEPGLGCKNNFSFSLLTLSLSLMLSKIVIIHREKNRLKDEICYLLNAW